MSAPGWRLRDEGPKVTQTDTGVAGHWSVIAHPPGRPSVDITYVRGVPTQIGDYSFTDPFGPRDLNLTFPSVTIMDMPGQGDLGWMVPFVDIDLRWIGEGAGTYDDWTWEGYGVSFSYALDGKDSQLSMTCIGAMLQLDNYLAVPEYPGRPIPYEIAIIRQFARSDLRLAKPHVEWPVGWSTLYTPKTNAQPWEIPAGLVRGARWSGLLTRQTGSFDQALTSYITQLLSAMYTGTGQWTLALDRARTPVLRLRPFVHMANVSTLVIDVATPGVEAQLDRDFTQTANVAYGQGTALAGYAYSGMRVSINGASTSYEPLAAMRQIDEPGDRHSWRQLTRMRKEINLQLQDGLSLEDARTVAHQHISRFADPGVTGTLTLAADPTQAGAHYPRQLVRAGMHIQLRGAFGVREGILLHITESKFSVEKEDVTLTVDSKFRDRLTVGEVRMRGRDSMSVVRGLIAGQYQPPVPDQLFPWSYAAGSGFMPSGPIWNAQRLFAKIADTNFPWTAITTKRPPSSASWRHCYMRLGPASKDANKNWGAVSLTPGSNFGFPIRMAQAGTIRLIQVAAYDKNGNVMKVPFHLGLYYANGVNYQAMPMLPAAEAAAHPPYKSGMHYPFFSTAFEAFNALGEKPNPNPNNAVESSGLIRVWGTTFRKAGYWPGDIPSPPTGLLVDESSWSFDCSGFSEQQFDPYSRAKNLVNPLAGRIYAMIYCDAQATQEVFFLGRIFRSEPGSAA